MTELDAFADLARRRRSSLAVDPDRAVPPDLVEKLCEIARWAPNHRRTWPWRFSLFTGDGRAALGGAFARSLPAGTEQARMDKTARKYLRAPSVLVVGTVTTTEHFAEEDRYATAAAIQNLLLAATAAGLASYWTTPPSRQDPDVLALAGMPAGTHLLGVIYLGWPAGEVPSPERPSSAPSVPG